MKLVVCWSPWKKDELVCLLTFFYEKQKTSHSREKETKQDSPLNRHFKVGDRDHKKYVSFLYILAPPELPFYFQSKHLIENNKKQECYQSWRGVTTGHHYHTFSRYKQHWQLTLVTKNIRTKLFRKKWPFCTLLIWIYHHEACKLLLVIAQCKLPINHQKNGDHKAKKNITL